MSKKVEPDFSQEPGPALHSARWRFGAFQLDETRRELRRDGELLEIEPKPLNMLMLLLRHPGELVTKTELLDALWTGRMVTEAVVGNCVSSVRDVLGDNGAHWLRTVHGFGYRFDAPVQLIEDENKAPTIAAPKLDFQTGDQPPMRPNWRLVRRLGQTGDTWLAQHIKLRERRVFKFTIEASGLSALKREVTIHRLLRQSLPGKDHYVDVLDWNFDEPPYFIETEYCNGGSLLEWFDTQGGAAKVPLETRIELIARIADALADVHIVGVLHKDLKPANVFVVPDDGGIPKIRLADFGASRLLDPNLLAKLEITRHGFTQVIDPNADGNTGTPLYLAPEVASGHPATAKSDIYALGVMLYQFVVGSLRRQLGAGWEIEIGDEMLREDIAAAAENNAERRVTNSAELARRLRSLGTRRKANADAQTAQRNAEAVVRTQDRAKARRTGLIAAFVALAVGFVTSTALYFDARSARQTAEVQTALAKQAAEQAARDGRRAKLTSSFLTEDLFTDLANEKKPAKELSVAELLKQGSARIAERFGDDPAIAADLRTAIGKSFNALDMLAEAEHELTMAWEIHTRVLGPTHPQALDDITELLPLRNALGHDRSYINALGDLLDNARKTLGPTDLAVIRLELQMTWPRLHGGELKHALLTYSRLASLLEATHPAADAELATALNGAAIAAHKLGHLTEALSFASRGLAHATRAFGPNHSHTGDLYLTLGRIANGQRRTAAAEDAFSQAVRIAERWGISSNGNRITGLIGLTRTRILQGRPREAEKIARGALQDMTVGGSSTTSPEGAEVQFDQTPPVRLVLSEALSAAGDYEAALRELETGLPISSKHYGADHILTREFRLRTIEQAIRLRRTELAQQRLNTPTPLAFTDLPAEHPLVTQLGMVFRQMGMSASEFALSRTGTNTP